MKVLGIETSTMLGGVAIMDSEHGLLAEARFNIEVKHSERLMSEVDYCLTRCSLKVSDLGGLAVSAGPGGFTGLRIGVSAAKGLAFASGLPLLGVSTLKAMAACYPYALMPVCAVLDARRSEVYAGLYESDKQGNMQDIMEEAPLAPEALAEKLKGLGRPVLIVGQGARIYREVFTAKLGERAVYSPLSVSVPSPVAVAALGLRAALEGRFEDPVGFAPRYLRKSEAEVKAEKAEKADDI